MVIKKLLITIALVWFTAIAAAPTDPSVRAISVTLEKERIVQMGSGSRNLNGDSLNFGATTKTWTSDWFYVGKKFFSGRVYASLHGFDDQSTGDTVVTEVFYCGAYAEFALVDGSNIHPHAKMDTLFWFKDTTKYTTVVTNGTFTVGTGWDLGTSGWAISSGAAHHTGTVSTVMYQDCLTSGKRYTTIFTVSAYGGAGKVTISAGGVNGEERAANGTYIEPVLCGATDGKLRFTSDDVMDVDNVSAILSTRSIVQDAYLVYKVASADTMRDGDNKPWSHVRLGLVFPDSVYCNSLGLNFQGAKNAMIDYIFFAADSTR